MYPDRYDPNFACTSLLGGRTVMTPNGPVCEISTTLEDQVKRDFLPYTLGPSLSAQATKNEHDGKSSCGQTR